MKKLISIILLSSLFLTGCKTAEDIKREKFVDALASQLSDAQKLNMKSSTRIQELEENVGNLSGKFEEAQHETNKNVDEKITALEEQTTLIKEDNELLHAKLKKQDAYLKKILRKLGSFSPPKKSKKKKVNKKKSAYDDANWLYKKGKYSKARNGFLSLINGNKVSGTKKARVLHNLGFLEYLEKNYEKSLTYFSKLYQEFPKSDYNQSGLLHIGKSFAKLKKNAEAKQSLNELIAKFPKSKKIAEAKKLLKKL